MLGSSGNPITLPPEATQVSVGGDGSVSYDGQLVERIGVFIPEGQLLRDSNTLFGAGGYAPVETTGIVQGALESSNVSPVLEVARMIEVQRAYEAGQSLLEKEDQRITQLINAVRER